MRHLWGALGSAVLVAACVGEHRDTSIAIAGGDVYWWDHPSLAVSASGVAVAWTYEKTSFRGVRVAKYEGEAWTQLGSDLSTSVVPQIAFAPDGTLLLKTEDSPPWSTEPAAIVVRRWTGTTWEPLGGTDVLPGQATSQTRMAVDSLGAPVIAAQVVDTSTGVTTSIALRRWDGAAWVTLPSGDFDVSANFAHLSRFALDSSDRPILLYDVGDVDHQAVLARWDGVAWTRASSASPRIDDLAVDSDGAIWLLQGDLRLSRFDGTSWTSSPHVSRPIGEKLGPGAVDIDGSGRPVVAWQQDRDADGLVGPASNGYVQRWTGDAWAPVLGPLYSSGSESFVRNVQLAFGGPYQAEPVVAWIGGTPVTSGTAELSVFVRVPAMTSD